MLLYQIDARIVHHTSNRECVSVDIPQTLPTFYLTKSGVIDREHAERIAKGIILPVELDYESVTVTVHASVIDTQ